MKPTVKSDIETIVKLIDSGKQREIKQLIQPFTKEYIFTITRRMKMYYRDKFAEII